MVYKSDRLNDEAGTENVALFTASKLQYAEAVPEQALYEALQKQFTQAKIYTKYVKAIIMYLNLNDKPPFFSGVKQLYDRLNISTLENEVLVKMKDTAPTSIEALQQLQIYCMQQLQYAELEVAVASCYYVLEHPKLMELSQKATMQQRLAKYEKDVQPENIVAIAKLVEELNDQYVQVLTIDRAFIEQLIEQRPLVVCMFLMKDALRALLLRDYEAQLLAYINNEQVYQQLLPYLKIYSGKTHGQWRHLVDSKKRCLVLKVENCTIAASKNIAQTFEQKEATFLTLEGLSVQATTDDAAVHYLEV